MFMSTVRVAGARRQGVWNGGGAGGTARAARRGVSAQRGGSRGGVRRRVGAMDGGLAHGWGCRCWGR